MISCWTAPQETPSVLRLFLDIEREAAEAYRHAVHEALVPRHPDAMIRMLGDHHEAALQLHSYLPPHVETGQPTVWTRVSRVVDSAAHFHAPLAGLWALHDAEAQAALDYEECLDLDALSGDCKRLVRYTLLPRAHRHVLELEALIEVICEEVEITA